LVCRASGANHVHKFTPPVLKPTTCPIVFETVKLVGPVQMPAATSEDLTRLHNEEAVRTPTLYTQHPDGSISCSTCDALAQRFVDSRGMLPRMTPTTKQSLGKHKGPLFSKDQQDAHRAKILTVLGGQLTSGLFGLFNCPSCNKCNGYRVSADRRSIVCSCSAPLITRPSVVDSGSGGPRFSACGLCGSTSVSVDPRAGHTVCCGCGSVLTERALDGGLIRHLADEDNDAKVHYQRVDPSRFVGASTVIVDGTATKESASRLRDTMSALEQESGSVDGGIETRDTRAWYKQRQVEEARHVLEDHFNELHPRQVEFVVDMFRSRRATKENMNDVAATLVGAILTAKHLVTAPVVARVPCPDCGKVVIEAHLRIPGRHICKLDKVKDAARRKALVTARKEAKTLERKQAMRRRKLSTGETLDADGLAGMLADMRQSRAEKKKKKKEEKVDKKRGAASEAVAAGALKRVRVSE